MYPDERRILMTPGPVAFSVETLKHMLSTAHEHTSPDFAQIRGEATRKFRRVIGMRGTSLSSSSPAPEPLPSRQPW